MSVEDNFLFFFLKIYLNAIHAYTCVGKLKRLIQNGYCLIKILIKYMIVCLMVLYFCYVEKIRYIEV